MPDSNATNLEIPVNVSFPNGKHKKPAVSNSTTQNNAVPAAKTKITWASSSSEDGLTITGVKFYSDSAKTREVTPSYFKNTGANDGNTKWAIEFNDTEVDDPQTLYYDLMYKDDDFDSLDWDPILTVEPRNITDH